MWRKWKYRDATKLRKLEREHNSLVVESARNKEMLILEISELQRELRKLKKAVEAKEVTHIQRIKVDVSKSSSWEDFPY